MAIAKKSRLYNKALRILHREITLLDKKSMKEGLSSTERNDLVKMLRPLEAEIKDDKPQKKSGGPSAELIRRAEEVIKGLKLEGTDAPADEDETS